MNSLQSRFSHCRILVVGDIMLDQYYFGKVGRISPEAPVPVVLVQSMESRLGGAANVAANVVGLGAQCVLAGYLGNDAHAELLRAQLLQNGISPCLCTWELPTITKTRVIGAHQQMLRMDFEKAGPVNEALEQKLLREIMSVLSSCQAVILSDYAKGCMSAVLCKTIILQAQKLGIPVLVDPKTRDWSRYQGVTLVTPNFSEFQEILGESFPNEDAQVEVRTAQLLERFNLQALLVTRSERGMTLHQSGKSVLHMHTKAREVFDVSGAGDTVVGSLAVALAAGLPMATAVDLSNHAAGVVVGKAGTVPIRWQELQQALLQVQGPQSKILESKLLSEMIVQRQADGQVVVFTNGCFDILHRGHLQYLHAARQLGDVLIVGLNSDASVRELKGPHRPVNKEADRALLLASLGFVDFVVIFAEDTPLQLLSNLRPDILVKGGDYNPDSVVGKEFVREVRILPFVEGFSTTSFIQRLRGDLP